MKNNGPTLERFMKDVEQHTLRVAHDDGVYRHIVLSSGSFNMRFSITTAPGLLLFTGDMGTFEFERIEDMFEFFRAARHDDPDDVGRINPDYWAEKCQAADRRTGGLSQFDRKLFDAEVTTCLTDFGKEHRLTRKEKQRLREEVNDQLLSAVEDDWRDLVRALEDFEFVDEGGREHHDVFGHEIAYDFGRMESWNYHFIWCCWAVRWAIAKYDAWKTTQPVTP